MIIRYLAPWGWVSCVVRAADIALTVAAADEK